MPGLNRNDLNTRFIEWLKTPQNSLKKELTHFQSVFVPARFMIGPKKNTPFCLLPSYLRTSSIVSDERILEYFSDEVLHAFLEYQAQGGSGNRSSWNCQDDSQKEENFKGLMGEHYTPPYIPQTFHGIIESLMYYIKSMDDGFSIIISNGKTGLSSDESYYLFNLTNTFEPSKRAACEMIGDRYFHPFEMYEYTPCTKIHSEYSHEVLCRMMKECYRLRKMKVDIGLGLEAYKPDELDAYDRTIGTFRSTQAERAELLHDAEEVMLDSN